MTAFQFLSTNGISTNVELMTDLIGYSDGSENLTVCQITNDSAKPLGATAQKLVNTFGREKYSASELKAFAVANNLTLKVRESGKNKAVITANTAA